MAALVAGGAWFGMRHVARTNQERQAEIARVGTMPMPTAAPPPGAPPVAETYRPAIPDREPHADELAILAPIAPGTSLGDFRVDKILAHNDILRVDASHGDIVIHVDIAFVGPRSPEPSKKVGRYGIYFQSARASVATAHSVCDLVGVSLQANANQPPPATMKDFPESGS